MVSAVEQATALKNDGNKAFAAHDWLKAAELYTKAIELNNNEPTYYTNRAQAYIKSEAFGYAIADATKAIELNPKFIKAYFRRAVSYAAILKPKDAVKDFKKCVELDPSNKDAKLKHAECQKIVRQLNFYAAIDVGDEPSASEGLDIDSIAIEPDYDGVQIQDEMTQEFIDDMIERFKNGKKIHRKYVYQIVVATKKIVYDEPTMVEMTIPDDVKLTVCGDTHGQYYDLMELFRLNGRPSDKHYYLFNGDFVDRGSWSTEIALLLYAYKWLRPHGMFLNRGNHETDDMNKVYGFEGECKAKYNERSIWLMMEMLWTDPQTAPGRGPSKRGVGMQFGPDVTKRFCDKNGLDAIIRSHEVRMEGYEEEHDGKCITVFSAPKYCDQTENRGAYINIGPDYKLNFHQFDAVEHPPIRPMAYANNSFGSMM
ncbi:hypothetical protein CIB48_g6144 [Xylaria polymorpha]|nr:hypothetical protein CIB48_g6144 [Xylaria polymorpha]